ncbi:P-loop containing nucleoside triphosphate hydrolase protein [Amniculicola lignicola CBS 123094]|uniref:P-loop containing nucleoside triphosphate hydrolase protein n=1 Tax=Amniculicola lignicola CBS 123094 TaxID=1392246 RepID=A0A6A5WVY2_9PLEO|nr:P-loop containing nucleoside triphosphate hydrolase protein [Amniculicola lignicola CBS 123094]
MNLIRGPFHATNHVDDPREASSPAMFYPGLRGLGLFTTSLPDPENSTAMDLAILATVPAGLAPALIPLYKLVHGIILKKRHYNITPTTTKIVLTVGAVIGIQWVWAWVKPFAIDLLTTSVRIPTQHRFALNVQEWLAVHAGGSAGRHVKLSANTTLVDSRRGRYAQPSNATVSSTRHTAAESGWFWLGVHPIHFEYTQKPKTRQRRGRFSDYGDLEEDYDYGGHRQAPGSSESSIRISCFRFSLGALEAFEAEVTAFANRDTGCTNIWTLYGDGSYDDPYAQSPTPWKVVRKPSRPLSTIDLDAKVKHDLVHDVSQFLAPDREKWYASRGIPYRRGILLHGNPGTGKSSTAISLAGEFKCDLYVINLSNCKGSLEYLFSYPKRGDIVLLEDIDSAGINRENMKGEKKASQNPDEMLRYGRTNQPITLSTLLNAIDSATGMNGVILMMTTNNPESLDKALIRPGRIDMQVHFGLVDYAVAESIFLRMYQDDDVDVKDNVELNGKETKRIYTMAKMFADKIPDRKLTPAEIQGFLTRNHNPEVALERAEEWVAEMLEAKEAERNIIGEGASKPVGKQDENSGLSSNFGDINGLDESDASLMSAPTPPMTVNGADPLQMVMPGNGPEGDIEAMGETVSFSE